MTSSPKGQRDEWCWHREPDTGDDWERVWKCCGGPYDERPHGHYADCPASVAAQADGELRAALTADLARLLTTWVLGVAHENAWNCADAILALPAVRQLLADAAKVQRVDRILRDVEDGWQPNVNRLTEALRRALDSDS